MDENFASDSMIHFDAWEPWEPELPAPKERKAGKHVSGTKSIFWRDHAVFIYFLIGALILTLGVILLCNSASEKAKKSVYEELGVEPGQIVVAVWTGTGQLPESMKEITKLTDGQEIEVVQRQVLTGAASKQEALKRDAIELAKDSDVWKTEEAFKAHCWCAVLRKWSDQYPNEIQTVLQQPYQFDYYNHDQVAYSDEKFHWAMDVLEQAETHRLPAGLTANHLHIEMKDAGRICILHTDPNHGYSDDQWRYKE